MKTGASLTLLAATVLVSGLANPGTAYADNVSGYRLDPAYNIRSQPSQESQRFSTIGQLGDEVVKFKPVPGNPKWLSVTRASGGEGYVHVNAMKKVEINNSYVIRSSPSLTGGTRLGTTGDSKKPQDLVLTGQTKVVKESGKTIQWLEVLTKGKKGWVAAGATKNIGETTSAPVAKKVAAAKPATEIKPPAPAKPAVAKVEKKTDQKTDQKTEKKEAAKPVAETKQASDAKGAADSKSAAKPVIKPEAKAAAKPAAKTEAAAPAPVAAKPAVEPKTAPKTAPQTAGDSPRSSALKRPAIPVDGEPNPTKKPTEVAKTEPLKKTEEPECVRTREEYQASARLKKVYGGKDPFGRWSGAKGGELIPDGKGNFTATVPGFAKLLGFGDDKVMPTQVCADTKTNKPYLLVYGKKTAFLDDSGSQIELKSKDGNNVYTRTGAGTAQ